MRKVIAVIGATGHQGSGLANAILRNREDGFTCRAITRKADGAQAKILHDNGAEIVSANLDDVESLKKAFTGAYGVYAVTNFWEHFSAEKELAQAKNIAEAAKAAGVQHIIWSTLEDTRKLMAADDTRMPILQGKYRVPHFDAKAEADAAFAESGVPTTFMRTSFYLDNAYLFGIVPKKNKADGFGWAMPMGDAKLDVIAADDIGKCAYGIFKAGDEYKGQVIGIAGEALTIAELSKKYEGVLGGPVTYTAVEADMYRGFGFDGAEEMGNMFQVYRDFEKEVLAARSVELARKLNPELLTVDVWLAKHGDEVRTAAGAVAVPA